MKLIEREYFQMRADAGEENRITILTDSIQSIAPKGSGSQLLVGGQWFVFPNITYGAMLECLGLPNV